ncbi:hypothetical protein AVEN_103062-1 [Araneus ventricosus]|uniref:Uncharacterized protein n=1 Tax=Araneus ventricosus TaxID=182803 RepID=A0A4Y2BAG8_ARAVE|nr:hypothetical protein AVEN_103062-1 [Araneus ventricosus]
MSAESRTDQLFGKQIWEEMKEKEAEKGCLERSPAASRQTSTTANLDTGVVQPCTPLYSAVLTQQLRSSLNGPV